MFGTTLIEHSALTNSLPEKSQGLAEAVTCRIEQKCQQEKKKKQGKKEMVLLIYFKNAIQ